MQTQSPGQRSSNVSDVTCPYCHTSNDGGNHFCRKCGAMLPTGAAASAAPPNPQATVGSNSAGGQSANAAQGLHVSHVPVEIAALVTAQVSALQGRIVERVEMLDKEIQELKSSRPWYRNASVLISLFAFLFSLGTTIFSYYQVRQEDEHNARIELRGIIQRLSEIPRQAATTAQQGTASGEISGLYQQENVILVKQALEIADKIPDQVTASEYIMLAISLGESSLYDDSLQIINKAESKIRNANDYVSLHRARGIILFMSRKFIEGRNAFGQALDVFNPGNYPTDVDIYREVTNIDTELQWSKAELSSTYCDEAKKHALNAQDKINRFLKSNRMQSGAMLDLQTEKDQVIVLIGQCPSAP